VRYSTLWQNLQTVAGLEKLAAGNDRLVSQQAQVVLAGTCDDIFGQLTKTASSPEKLASEVMAMRDAHRITGEKLAASPVVTAEYLQKLAVATYVDGILTGQLEKLSGEEYDAARSVQLLGREYGVTLLRGLLA
jgi:hypothetical protein